MRVEPRGWQIDAIAAVRVVLELRKSFLLSATPGAGKTIFSGLVAKAWIDDDIADFVIAVVPTTALKGDSHAGFLGDWHRVGVEITRVLKDGRGRPREYSGAVITYQQLPNLISTFEVWRGRGVRLAFVFDEIHHACESNRWGAAASRCHEMAEKVLSMTGTPFRGDGQRISFVNYNDNGVAVPDHSYSYRSAIKDFVCRVVDFITDDGIAEYFLNGENNAVRISESNGENEAPVKNVIYGKDAEFTMATLEKADQALDGYRAYDVDAGGLVICRPGYNDEDDRHLHSIAAMLRRITGEEVTVVTHDDEDANSKIESFRRGSSKWIVAVRKISEGVDIKRLRVLVMASKPSTELLFRQVVGRVVRQESSTETENATVFMAKFPRLTEWAGAIQEEAASALREIEQRDSDPMDREESTSDFISIGSSHEDGGAISTFGEMFTAAEIGQAERIKEGEKVLENVSVTAIAHILKKTGVEPPAGEAVEPPLHERKLKKRSNISRLVRVLTSRVMRENSQGDYGSVASQLWSRIHTHMGVRSLDDLMDNHSLDRATTLEEYLKRLLEE